MKLAKHRLKVEEQSELFNNPPGRPSWSDLPEDARRAATVLLARMFRLREAAPSATPEVDHE